MNSSGKYPTVDEFKSILANANLEEIVKKYLFGNIPIVFNGDRNKYDLFRSILCKKLGLREECIENICIVGSGCIGFSLDPDNFPRRFYEQSDIDIVVVNENMFDEIWYTIIKWYLSKRDNLARYDLDWIKILRKDILCGWLVPDRIKYNGEFHQKSLTYLRDTSVKWFNSFNGMIEVEEFSMRKIRGRLYRTWEHAICYHAEGLARIKGQL